MKIEIGKTVQGYPQVAWVQMTSETGETVGSRKRQWYMATGLVGGFVLGLSTGDPKLIFGGPLVGLALMLAARGHEEKQRGGPDKRDEEPILCAQYCEARIERQGDELALVWSLKGKRHTDGWMIPLNEASELAVGSYNEWFSDRSAAVKFHESHVIVMTMADGRVLRLADHAGRQSEVAELHAVLSQTLIEPRAKFLRDVKAEVRGRDRGISENDVPESI